LGGVQKTGGSKTGEIYQVTVHGNRRGGQGGRLSLTAPPGKGFKTRNSDERIITAGGINGRVPLERGAGRGHTTYSGARFWWRVDETQDQLLLSFLIGKAVSRHKQKVKRRGKRNAVKTDEEECSKRERQMGSLTLQQALSGMLKHANGKNVGKEEARKIFLTSADYRAALGTARIKSPEDEN